MSWQKVAPKRFLLSTPTIFLPKGVRLFRKNELLLFVQLRAVGFLSSTAMSSKMLRSLGIGPASLRNQSSEVDSFSGEIYNFVWSTDTVIGKKCVYAKCFKRRKRRRGDNDGPTSRTVIPA